jgi:hypothetical protein
MLLFLASERLAVLNFHTFKTWGNLDPENPSNNIVGPPSNTFLGPFLGSDLDFRVDGPLKTRPLP